MQTTEDVIEKFYNICSERFKEIPWKTSVVVFYLNLPNKSIPPGRLLLRSYEKVVVMVFFCADAVAQKC